MLGLCRRKCRQQTSLCSLLGINKFRRPDLCSQTITSGQWHPLSIKGFGFAVHEVLIRTPPWVSVGNSGDRYVGTTTRSSGTICTNLSHGSQCCGSCCCLENSKNGLWWWILCCAIDYASYRCTTRHLFLKRIRRWDGYKSIEEVISQKLKD